HLCWRGCTGRRRTGRHLPSRCARSPGGTVSGGCSRRLPPSACSRSRHPDTDAGRALRFRFRQLSRDRRSNRRRGAVNRRWKAAAWPESRADSHRQLATVCDAAGCPHFHQCLRGSGRRDGTRQLPGRGPAVYPIAGTSVRRRARRPLAARGARGPVPTLEESVKLDEPEPRVLRGNPVRSVVIAYAGSQLHELHRRQLVHNTQSALAVSDHAPVRIKGLVRDLEIVAGRDGPVGLEQPGCRRHALDRPPFVLDAGHLSEPYDRAGAYAAEDAEELAPEEGRVVVIGREAEAPPRPHVAHLQSIFLAATRGKAPRQVAFAHRELRIPMTAHPAELHAIVGTVHIGGADGIYERGLILETKPEWQVHLPRLDVPIMVRRPEKGVGLMSRGS